MVRSDKGCTRPAEFESDFSGMFHYVILIYVLEVLTASIIRAVSCE